MTALDRTTRLFCTMALLLGDACLPSNSTRMAHASTGPSEGVTDEPRDAYFDTQRDARPVRASHRTARAGHRFTPQSSAPRPRMEPARVTNVEALPRLVDRSRQCFGEFVDDEGYGPTRRTRSGHGYGRGGGGGLGSVGGSAVRSAAKASVASGPSSPAAEVSGLAAAPSGSPPSPSAKRSVQADAAGGYAPEARGEAEQDLGRMAKKKAERPMDDRRAGREEKGRSDDAPMREPDGFVRDADDGSAAGFGVPFYLSNDDTMSLSSAQRIIYAIERALPLPLEHIRPHELLNYFSFPTAEVERGRDFSVLAEFAPKGDDPHAFTLALSTRGRPVDRDSRRSAAITLVLDRSGSMQDEGRMSYLKKGLRRMLDELKRGDIVNLVLFDDQVCTPLSNFVVGRDARQVLERVIDRVQPRGSTDVHAGLREGYALADRAYQDNYTNRVVLITDAIANTGVTDAETIALIGQYYDARRIRLSGVGVGRDFNDDLLDRLTEKGRGAYVFLGSDAEVDAVFGSRFVSLLETTANDVHFRLHLPPSLRLEAFYGEESSVHREDVQAIHYFADTSQLFLVDLIARDPEFPARDDVMLSIEYEDAETGEGRVEEVAFRIGDIARDRGMVDKGRAIVRFVDGLRATAPGLASGSAWRQGDDRHADASHPGAVCADVAYDLDDTTRRRGRDRELRRIRALWDTYCQRFAGAEPTRHPPRHGKRGGWPSARG